LVGLAVGYGELSTLATVHIASYGVQESGCAALRNLGCGKSPEARLTLI